MLKEEHISILVYISDFSIIHYASRTGDLGEDICIHETTLDKFLDGATSYFVCKYPKIYGKPSEIDIESLASSLYYKDKFYDLFHFFKRHNYKLYSPKETVERARSRIGEGEYNLITNNCEHFALWCKTGISESHQVNNLLNIILGESIYL